MICLKRPVIILIPLLLGMRLPLVGALAGTDKGFREWTLEQAVEILNQSPWARQETFTRVIGGIGSGISGEKEIYSTYFVRFLSARPIREAFARVNQIQQGYDQLSEPEKRRVDESLAPGLELDFRRWIVVTVNFRSNDPETERYVQRFFQVQTSATIKSRAFLSTARFPQLQIVAYYPPRGDVLGAKFVFAREVDGSPVVSPNDTQVSFELEVPGRSSDLRVTFSVPPMMVEGELVL